MRVVTWNLGFWQHKASHSKAWRYLRSNVKPDLALLQEVSPPKRGENEYLLFKNVHGSWGTALYSRDMPLEELPFRTHSERVAIAKIELRTGQEIVVASIHAPIIKHRVFPYLDRIFDEIESRVDERAFIVGGDLNTARLAEEVWPGHGHGPFFERIAKGRFFDCVQKFFAEEPQTVFRPGQKHAFQDDHIFVSHDFTDKVESCNILNNNLTRVVSDHIPVTIEINL